VKRFIRNKGFPYLVLPELERGASPVEKRKCKKMMEFLLKKRNLQLKKI